MIALDTNILVYAHRPDSPHHTVAAAAVKRVAESGAPWSIPWACVHEFLSVSTNPKIFRPPTPPDVAFLTGKLRGPQMHDARIHAICRPSGVRELWSADRDFSRMRGLMIVNPCLS